MVTAGNPDARIVALVQARANSARLPGKVLRPVGGRPMVAYLLERLRHATGIDDVVLATSERASDDALAAVAAKEGCGCYRGPLDNVATRLLGAARNAGAHAFVRLSGDSPLLDVELISRAVALYREGAAEIVTNVLVRTFPKGQSVEVIDTETLGRALPEFTVSDREHVTTYFYRNPTNFRIVGFERDFPLPHVQTSVDVEDDFRRLEHIVGRMQRPHWTYGLDEILELGETMAGPV
jgi:spore coat polysaccharide biosynthesis protein SpsF